MHHDLLIPIDSVVHYYRHIEINIILRLLKKKERNFDERHRRDPEF